GEGGDAPQQPQSRKTGASPRRIPDFEETTGANIAQRMPLFAMLKERANVNLTIPINHRMKERHETLLGPDSPPVGREKINRERNRTERGQLLADLPRDTLNFPTAQNEVRREPQRLQLKIIGAYIDRFGDGLLSVTDVQFGN